MVRVAVLMLALFAVSALAGCTGADDGDGTTTTSASSTGSQTSAPAEDPCPTVDDESVVSGWTAHGGVWGTVASAGGRTDVVCGKADGAVQSLVRDGGAYTDFEAFVSFNMLDSCEDVEAGCAGVGLVIHFEDEENFNIVRYSPREQGWHLFTMVAGNRQKQDNASVTPPTTNPELGDWVRLRVVSENGTVTAYDGTTKVIDYELEAEASHEGGIGYFLRDAGTAALFDDFSVEAL